jgi:hypothetical protein
MVACNICERVPPQGLSEARRGKEVLIHFQSIIIRKKL